MCSDEDCSRWEKLYAEAQEEAQRHLPTAEGRDEIRQALDRAREDLGGEDVREHRISFDPAAWQLDNTALPRQALDSREVSRGDGLEVTAEVDANVNWRLFCTSFVFGYGLSGLGPVRFRRIIGKTPPQKLSAVVGEARKRINTCGPLAAYEYLRHSNVRSKVPGWGPAFFTKLLYFADTPGEGISALILDNRIARIVKRLSGMRYLVIGRRSYRWTAYRYGVYLAWMHVVSEEMDVQADFLEYALFTNAR